MPIYDNHRIYDGYFSLEGGMDGGRGPHLIDKNQVAESRNTIFRGGDPTNRPPFRTLQMDFENPDMTYNVSGAFISEDGSPNNSVNNFQNGVLQEADYYGPEMNLEYIMASVGGRLYRIKPEANSVTIREIKLLRRNRNNLNIAYMVQADIYHVTQDGEGAPIIFDGSTARRAIIGEIFTGTIMAYGLGRIVMIGLDSQVYFLDIFNGKGNGGADVLGATETLFLNEGFPSALPPTMGKPTAVRFLPQQDAATGIGDLMVFGQSGAEAFTISIPREQWKDSQFQREALRSIGNQGHRLVADVNNDIFFRSSEGWRSYRQARAEIDKWGQVPLSTNVEKWVDVETQSILKYGSAITFDNRLLTTCTPQPNSGRPYHMGMLSLDFDPISTFGNSSNPAWDGHWSERTDDPLLGLKVTRLVEGKFRGENRAFAFVIDENGHNVILEIAKQAEGHDTDGKITSTITMRSMDFGALDNEKLILSGDVWVDEVSEPIDLDATYRPDQIPQFLTWDSFSVESQGVPGAITPGMVPTASDGYSPRKSLQAPSDDADPVTSRLYRRGYEFQPRIKWTGRAHLRRFRMHALNETEDSLAVVT